MRKRHNQCQEDTMQGISTFARNAATLVALAVLTLSVQSSAAGAGDRDSAPALRIEPLALETSGAAPRLIVEIHDGDQPSRTTRMMRSGGLTVGMLGIAVGGFLAWQAADTYQDLESMASKADHSAGPDQFSQTQRRFQTRERGALAAGVTGLLGLGVFGVSFAF
jgi:hypothetical protein